MNPLSAFRARVPEIALLMACVMTAGALGFSLGVHTWLVYVATGAVSVLAVGAGLRLLARRHKAPSPRSRTRHEVLPGGKTPANYDLAKDQSTDSQRYLM